MLLWPQSSLGFPHARATVTGDVLDVECIPGLGMRLPEE